MKKLLIILAILLLPLSVWAMTPISDADLSGVTGQAGVNINADLMIDISPCTIAWGDASGLDWTFGWDTNMNDALGTGADGAGYWGLPGFNINSLHIKPMTGMTAEYSIAADFTAATYIYREGVVIKPAAPAAKRPPRRPPAGGDENLSKGDM